MNNLLLALILAAIYYVAANASAQTDCGYNSVDNDTPLRQYSRARPRLLGHKITGWDRDESNGAGVNPACSLSFEDRQQLEQLMEEY